MGARRYQIPPTLRVARAVAEELTQAARDADPVAGLTHNFYRYPARFSPKLVRAAIHAFTKPGDLVLDPFLGSDTTAVVVENHHRRWLGIERRPIYVWQAREMDQSRK